MQYRLTPPPSTESPLGRLDPRWRLAGLLAVVVAVAFVRSLPGAILAAAGGLVLVALARVNWAWYRDGLVVVGSLVALFALPLPLLARVDVVEGLRLGGLFLAKALALYSLTAALLSSPLEATLKAARSLLIPGLLVQLALLSYRYLFVLAEELGRLRVALRVRGYRNRADWHGYRTVSAATGTLLVRGHDRAQRVAQAMRCRGFDGEFRSLADHRTRPADVLAAAALLGCAVALVALDLFVMRS